MELHSISAQPGAGWRLHFVSRRLLRLQSLFSTPLIVLVVLCGTSWWRIQHYCFDVIFAHYCKPAIDGRYEFIETKPEPL